MAATRSASRRTCGFVNDPDSIIDTKSTCPATANAKSIASFNEIETRVDANSRKTGKEIVAVLDADNKLLTKARAKFAVAVAVLD